MTNQTIDISQLESLIEADKFDEAKELIASYFKQPLSTEERGQAYLDVASTYLDIANHFNKERAELLESSVKALEDLNKKDKSLEDLISLQNIRNKLK